MLEAGSIIIYFWLFVGFFYKHIDMNGAKISKRVEKNPIGIQQ